LSLVIFRCLDGASVGWRTRADRVEHRISRCGFAAEAGDVVYDRPGALAQMLLARIVWLQGLPDQGMRAAENAVRQAEAI
jgi:hypothetical protein